MILKVETDRPHIEPSSFKIKLAHISFWYLLEMGCGTITVPLELSSQKPYKLCLNSTIEKHISSVNMNVLNLMPNFLIEYAW